MFNPSDMGIAEVGSEAMLRAVVDGSPDTIMTVDREGVIRFSNRSTGAAAAEGAVGSNSFDLLQLRDRPRYRQALDRAFERQEADAFEHAATDGSWWQARVVPMSVEGPQRLAMVISRDVTEQVRLAGAERQTRHLLQSVIEGIDDAVYVKDLAGRYLMVNSSGARSIGRTPQEMVGRDDAASFAPQTAAELRAHDLAIMNSGEPRTLLETTTASGVTKQFLSTKCPFYDEEGKLAGLMGISRDVTAVRRIEAALRESEQTFQMMAEAISDCISLTGTNRRVQYVSPAFYRLTGYTADELLSGDCCDPIHADDRPLAEQALAANLRGEATRVQVRCRRKDGEPIWIEMTSQPILGPDGKVSKIASCSRDITRLRQAEEAIVQRERRWRAIVEAQPECVKLVAPDGTLLEMNPAGLAILEADGPQAVLGRKIWELLVPEHLERYRAFHERICQGGSGTLEFDLVTLRGARRTMSTQAVPFPLDGSGTLAHLAVARDISDRKRTEERLRQAEERYRRIFENAFEGMCQVTPDGRFVTVNRALAEILGYDSPEDLMASVSDLETQVYAHPHDRLALREQLEQQGYLQGAEVEAIRKDGSLIWVRFNSRVVRDAAGRTLHYESAVEDVSERRRSEAAIRKLSGFREALIHSAAEGICACYAVEQDPHIVFTVWNDRMREITGYSLDEINRLGWYQSVFPDPTTRRRAIKRMKRLLEGDHLQGEEWEITRKNGARRTVAVTTSNLHTDDGLDAVVALMQDVTERRQAEQALRENEARFRQYADAMPHVIWMISPDKRRLYFVNRAFEEIFARPRSELESNPLRWLESVHPDDRQRLLAEPARKDSASYLLEYRIVRPDGSVRWLRERGIPIRAEQGDVYMHAGIAEDITSLKRQEEELANQQAQLAHFSRLSSMGEMVAGIAHEITQPLTAVVNYAAACETLLRAGSLRELAAYLGEVSLQATRAGEITHRLRSFSRKTDRRQEPLALDVLVRESHGLVAADLRRQRAAVELRLAVPQARALVDRIQIQQVIVNLLLNACEACQDLPVPRRRITLSTERLGSELLVEVRDQGTGLSPESSARLFVPFWTTKPAGMGIGLAICKSLIESHGGRIWHESPGGPGAVFRFTLPEFEESHR